MPPAPEAAAATPSAGECASHDEASLAAAVAALADGLAGPGWAVSRTWLPRALALELGRDAAERVARGELRPAAVGAGAASKVRPAVRGDLIRWLISPTTAAQHDAFARLERLRVALNRDLMLGLDELECHYASYPPGARYARHLDRSPGGVERAVSFVFYLNDGWSDADGGQLRLHLRSGRAVDVLPEAGTVALFLSERIEHEVLPARRARLSLTGWFRRRPVNAVVV